MLREECNFMRLFPVLFNIFLLYFLIIFDFFSARDLFLFSNIFTMFKLFKMSTFLGRLVSPEVPRVLLVTRIHRFHHIEQNSVSYYHVNDVEKCLSIYNKA